MPLSSSSRWHMYMHMHTEIRACTSTEQAYGRMDASKHGKARSVPTLSAKRTAGTMSAGSARTEAISSGVTGVRVAPQARSAGARGMRNVLTLQKHPRANSSARSMINRQWAMAPVLGGCGDFRKLSKSKFICLDYLPNMTKILPLLPFFLLQSTTHAVACL